MKSKLDIDTQQGLTPIIRNAFDPEKGQYKAVGSLG